MKPTGPAPNLSEGALKNRQAPQHPSDVKLMRVLVRANNAEITIYPLQSLEVCSKKNDNDFILQFFVALVSIYIIRLCVVHGQTSGIVGFDLK